MHSIIDCWDLPSVAAVDCEWTFADRTAKGVDERVCLLILGVVGGVTAFVSLNCFDSCFVFTSFNEGSSLLSVRACSNSLKLNLTGERTNVSAGDRGSNTSEGPSRTASVGVAGTYRIDTSEFSI